MRFNFFPYGKELESFIRIESRNKSGMFGFELDNNNGDFVICARGAHAFDDYVAKPFNSGFTYYHVDNLAFKLQKIADIYGLPVIADDKCFLTHFPFES